MEVHATRDSSFEDEPAPAASILPPRESSPGEPELAFDDQAPRVDSDPPQVLDVAALDELSFRDEAPRIDSDPPQVLDLGELALHEVSQRIDSDPPQVLDVAALELAEHAPGAEVEPAEPAEPDADLGLRPEPEAPTLATPGVGPLPAERARPKLVITPRAMEGASSEEAASASPVARTVGGSTAETEGEPIGTPLRPRKLLAPREVQEREAIDAELIPDEVHEEFAQRRAAQDLSVAERQARATEANKRSALVMGGVFALGAVLLSFGSGFGAFVVFVLDVAFGAGTGWYLGTKRPNRLVGAVTTWAAAIGLALVHIAAAVALYGTSSLLALLFPLIFFQAIAALSGMFLATHLESLEFDQSI